MKKILTVIVSLCVLVSSVSIGFIATASTQTQVYVSVYDNAYTLEPTLLSVSADLSDTYESVTGYNDTQTEPTILDAIIAAHIQLYGESFTFSCSGGWISYAFEQSAYNITYRQNGDMAYSLDTALNSGDYIDIDFYQDTTAYSDVYACFDTRTAEIEQGESITLTATGEGYDSAWNMVSFSLADMPVTANGESVGTLDSNGKITLSFDTTGTYKITTASSLNSTPVMAPFATIVVTEKATAATTTASTTATTSATTSTTSATTTAKATTSSSSQSTTQPSSSELETVIIGAAKYVVANTDSFTVDNAIDYLTVINSGIDTSSTDEAFIQSVKDNLTSNNGKLVVNGAENIGTYGAVIQILYSLGYDAENFEGYNIVEAFTSMDMSTPADNPYYYRVAIETSYYIGDDDFAKTLCNSLIDNYYTMGSGMNYYGYSCDNTAMFITSLAYYYDDYQDVVDDALTVLETYKVNGGYCYNPSYSTQANCDSTAMALMAYSALSNLEKANSIYYELMEFESDDTGVFTYDSQQNLYATKDALLALEYYYTEVLIDEIFNYSSEVEETSDDSQTTTADSSDGDSSSSSITTTKSTATTNANTSKISPSTGYETALTAGACAFVIAAACVMVMKKKIK